MFFKRWRFTNGAVPFFEKFWSKKNVSKLLRRKVDINLLRTGTFPLKSSFILTLKPSIYIECTSCVELPCLWVASILASPVLRRLSRDLSVVDCLILKISFAAIFMVIFVFSTSKYVSIHDFNKNGV